MIDHSWVNDAIEAANQFGRNFSGVYVRPSVKDIEIDLFEIRAQFESLGWKYQIARRAWETPQGGILQFRAVGNDGELHKLHGRRYNFAACEYGGKHPELEHKVTELLRHLYHAGPQPVPVERTEEQAELVPIEMHPLDFRTLLAELIAKLAPSAGMEGGERAARDILKRVGIVESDMAP